MSEDNQAFALIGKGLRQLGLSLMGGLRTLLRRVWELRLPGCRPLTTLERVQIWCLISYLLWLNKSKKLDFLNNLLDKIVPLWSYLRYRINGPKVKFAEDGRLGKRVLEAARVGSEETAMSVPKCQVLIGQMKDGDFVAHGCGVRMENALVMPDHVYSYGNRDGETGTAWVMGRQKSRGVCLHGKEVHVIDTDLVWIELTADEWSIVGAAVQNIYHEIPERGNYAQVVGYKGLGTAGIVAHDPTCFGRVIYEATTLPGYSGAAYMVANRIAGIHQSGSSKVNGGYSASYVWMMVSYDKKNLPEATEEFLMDQYNDGYDIHVDLGWKDLDRVRIKTGGRYHLVERSSMNKAFGSDWHGRDRVRHRKGKHYDDFPECAEQGNGMVSSSPSGLSSQDDCPAQEGCPVLQLTAGYLKLSDEQQRRHINNLNNLRKKRNTPRGLLVKSSEV